MAEWSRARKGADDVALAPRTMLWRAGVAFPFLAVLLWLVIATGIAANQARFQPAIAHASWGIDARASAALGRAMLLASTNPARMGAARALALQAIARDPTVVDAYSVLGLTADIAGERARAERIFHYAHRLSRRDLATELWLIEANVSRNDVAGALDHFDAAMTSTTAGWSTLSPILLAALEDPQLVDPIAELIARKRWWAEDFQKLVAAESKSWTNAVGFFIRMHARGAGGDSAVLQRLATRLVVAHRPDEARALDALIIRTRYDRIRDGGFEQQRGLLPFQWELANTVDTSVEHALRPDQPKNMALVFTTSERRRPWLVRQLLALPPGKYTLSTHVYVEEVEGGWALNWAVTCEGGETEATSTLPWPAAGRPWARHAAEFTVPSGCRYQWVQFSAEGAGDAVRLAGWLDDVAIVPAR